MCTLQFLTSNFPCISIGLMQKQWKWHKTTQNLPPKCVLVQTLTQPRGDTHSSRGHVSGAWDSSGTRAQGVQSLVPMWQGSASCRFLSATDLSTSQVCQALPQSQDSQRPRGSLPALSASLPGPVTANLHLMIWYSSLAAWRVHTHTQGTQTTSQSPEQTGRKAGPRRDAYGSKDSVAEWSPGETYRPALGLGTALWQPTFTNMQSPTQTAWLISAYKASKWHLPISSQQRRSQSCPREAGAQPATHTYASPTSSTRGLRGLLPLGITRAFLTRITSITISMRNKTEAILNIYLIRLKTIINLLHILT